MNVDQKLPIRSQNPAKKEKTANFALKFSEKDDQTADSASKAKKTTVNSAYERRPKTADSVSESSKKDDKTVNSA